MDWSVWTQLGVPMAILAAIGVAMWRGAKFLGARLFGGGGDDQGLVGRWFAGEEQWRNALTQRLEQQQGLCDKHASCLTSLDATMQEGQKIAANGNALLATLVAIHEQPGGSAHEAMAEIHATSDDMRRMKQAANRACEMCREIARAEWPNSAEQISRHCDEIERIIGEA